MQSVESTNKFGAHMNILYIIKVKILNFLYLSNRTPRSPVMMTIEPRIVNKFEHVVDLL